MEEIKANTSKVNPNSKEHESIESSNEAFADSIVGDYDNK